MYGAENPYYSISALDIDLSKYPLMVSLQTLMSDSVFLKNYPIDNRSYNFRSSIEQKIIKRIDYIGSSVQKYRQIIWSSFNPKAIFFKTYLAVEEKVDIINMDKKYDFVFFAASINKSADVAIEAFALVCKKYPKLTLNIIGGTPEPFTGKLKLRIKELGIENNVYFSGKLPEHKEVLEQIQFASFALLPMATIVSGTIREALFAGLPVVTTIVEGTNDLNKEVEIVLASEPGDIVSIANNMIKLIDNPGLALQMSEQGKKYANESWNNKNIMLQLVEAYHNIIEHHCIGGVIPSEIRAINPVLSKKN